MADETVKTLSNTAKRKSIGEAKKLENSKKKNARVRTTVLNPREIEWPELSDEAKKELLPVIKTLTEALKIPCRKVPLQTIREVAQKDRSEFRKQWLMTEALRLNVNLPSVARFRSSLVIGVNCVSKALEVNQLVAVLIEQNVHPQIITKLLIPLANSRNVPIIAFEGLNSTFQEATDMRCIALGLKKSCEQISDHFHPLLEMVRKLVTEANSVEMDSTQTYSTSTIHGTPAPLPHPTPSSEPQTDSGKIRPKSPKRKKVSGFQSPKVRRAESK